MDRKEEKDKDTIGRALAAGYRASRIVGTAHRRASEETAPAVLNELSRARTSLEEALFCLEEVKGVEGSIDGSISSCREFVREYARAIDAIHRSVLDAFGLERILTPEEDAARGLVHLLEFGADIETFRVDANYYVVKFTVPERFVGYSVNELKLDKEFGLKLLALKRAETLKNCLGISFTEHDVVNGLPDDDLIQAGDRLVCYGQYRDFRKFWKAL